MHCKYCGNKIEDNNYVYCKHCGKKIEKKETNKKKNNANNVLGYIGYGIGIFGLCVSINVLILLICCTFFKIVGYASIPYYFVINDTIKYTQDLSIPIFFVNSLYPLCIVTSSLGLIFSIVANKSNEDSKKFTKGLTISLSALLILIISFTSYKILNTVLYSSFNKMYGNIVDISSTIDYLEIERIKININY